MRFSSRTGCLPSSDDHLHKTLDTLIISGMNQPLPHAWSLFHGRHFDRTIIILCVRWYITYKLSYRDLVEMMAERGVHVSHTTILRWVQRYVPEFEKRWRRYARPVGTAWRVDETYIRVRGGLHQDSAEVLFMRPLVFEGGLAGPARTRVLTGRRC